MLFLLSLLTILHTVLTTEVGSRGPASSSGAYHSVGKANKVVSKDVLVLGGQGLSGSASVEALLVAGYKVTVLNNGKNYFDYSQAIVPKVNSIMCLRKGGLDGCFELQQYLQSTKRVLAIVDFTSSNPEYMQQSVRLLGKLDPDVYIFVSAAAVYDVAKDFRKSPIPESVAVRPENAELREKNAEVNTFGDNMLGAEEVLTESGLPYVILRSADTVGSRDTTHRWWQYQMWASYYNIINQAFPVPDHLVYTQFSLTYGPDVGQAVVSVLDKQVTNEEYNIAIDRTFTLANLLLEICTHLNVTECTADYEEKTEMYALYPSNHNGPLDTSKAKAVLKFEPSPWETVLKETVAFYKGALDLYIKERATVLERLNKNMVPYTRIQPLYNAINADAPNAEKMIANGDPVFDNAEKGSGEGEKVPEPEKEGDKEEL